MPPSPRPAFTLIELLVVVAVIAILAAIALPNFLEAQVRAKVSRSKNDLRVLGSASMQYYLDNNQYPPDNFPGQTLDIQSLQFLTTPVAYLSSVPGSPFEESPPVGYRLPDQYEYWLGFVEAGRMVFDDGAGMGGVFCRFTSVGPNAQPDYQFGPGTDISPRAIASRAPAFLAGLYDPTNGTVSFGDILASNRGLEAGG